MLTVNLNGKTLILRTYENLDLHRRIPSMSSIRSLRRLQWLRRLFEEKLFLYAKALPLQQQKHFRIFCNFSARRNIHFYGF